MGNSDLKNLEVILETKHTEVASYLSGFLTGIYYGGLLYNREQFMNKGNVYRWKLTVRELFNRVEPKELNKYFNKVLSLGLGPSWRYKLIINEERTNEDKDESRRNKKRFLR